MTNNKYQTNGHNLITTGNMRWHAAQRERGNLDRPDTEGDFL
jgi:hypothetical protein